MKSLSSQNIFEYFLVFLGGMFIFIIEILGSRIIGPYIGGSLYTWTALLSVILFFLSFGSIVGGRIADVYLYQRSIFLIFNAVLLSLFLLIISDRYIATLFVSLGWDARITAIVISSLLFGPLTFILAMIFPVVAKKIITNLHDDGKILGKISMLSTYGSLVGIFLSLFLFIPTIGVEGTLIILMGISICILVGISKKKIIIFLAGSILLFLSSIFIFFEEKELQDKGIQSIDTLYSRINIVDEYIYGAFHRMFIIDTRVQSEYNLETGDLVPYTEKNFFLFSHFIPDPKQVLMIGGAGYTFPTEFVKLYPQTQIDVVEIDSQMEAIAEEYFLFEQHKNIRTIHTDGRYYLNQSKKKYDVIFGDAYVNQRTVPYQLTTLEAIEKKYSNLEKQGVVIENIISSLKGDTSLYLQSQYNAFKQVFDEVYIYSPRKEITPDQVQNLFLIAVKGEFSNEDSGLYAEEKYLQRVKFTPETDIFFTDDYAPIEQIVAPMNRVIRKNSINSQ